MPSTPSPAGGGLGWGPSCSYSMNMKSQRSHKSAPLLTSPLWGEGFNHRLPAEWEPQESILLAWPHNKNDWPGKFGPIPWVYAEFIGHIARTQRVRLIVKNKKQRDEAIEVLTRAHVNLGNVVFHELATNRVWTRDSGPITVMDGKTPVALDFNFTAWAKYPNYKLDNQVPAFISKAMKRKTIKPMHKGRHVVLEGGAIDANGAGVLITTEECLLSEKIQCRNPGFTRADYETVFKNYMGIDQVIWLESGIVGDDTHGHVDDITRFVSTNTIVTCVEKNRKDENHEILNHNLSILKKSTDKKGKKFSIIELPMPRIVNFENTRLPASYANFLICNDVVLVPTFNDANDRIALNTIADCFKGRDVIGTHCTDMVWGFGTLHCASMQLPL